jgi:ribulose-5-phosphate 4-epimerase/fuculose-1-phosphate aldolase
MNANFSDKFLYVHQFSTPNIFKSDKIYQFLLDFSKSFDYQIINSLDNLQIQTSTKPILFLVTSIADLETLERIKCRSTVKIIAYFLTHEEFNIIKSKEFRAALKSRGFQYICPDRAINNNRLDLIYPSCMKICDTVTFKTTRNKFSVTYLGDDIEEYLQLDPSIEFSLMVRMGWYLREMNLNNSDSMAGGIAVRFGSGFLVTASATDKYRIITPERICYVEEYDPQSNRIRVIEKHPPSSETALFHSIFNIFPDTNVILHFHYKPISYGTQFDRYRTSNYTPYGTWEEAEIVTAKLQETRDFAIANSHGEFVIGTNFDAIKNIIDRIVNLL